MRTAVIATTLAMMGPAALGQEIHIVHCFEGACPTGADTSNDLVVYEIFALSASDTTKFADWVAYRPTRATMETTVDLNRGWQTDDFLAENETLEAGRGDRDDYHRANRQHGYDRGHQAPLAAFAGTVYWRSTNIYSNITPQLASLNQGPWLRLETAVRDLTYAERELWVLTGPLYNGTPMPELSNAGEAHQVPTSYWKIVVDSDGNSAAFLFDHRVDRDDDFCRHRTTVTDLAQETGLDLFPSNGVRDNGALLERLGCPAQP